MRDRSDSEQARVFYELLVAEAASLEAAIRAMGVTSRGTPRATTESQLLHRELREVRRCLDNLVASFPDLGQEAASG
ncbi:hypothetical protein ACTD5D_06860 [Nocardia takedensis]|uniref:hypothetical protein n=1 Tax=Nocardia takedensis TaxID=259390 RepID=UPI0002D905E4|nr:hypothetical protein [Nocardia takedensis]